MSASTFDSRSPRQPSPHERIAYTTGDVVALSLFVLGQVGQKAVHGARVAAETITTTIQEGNEAAACLREQGRRTLEAFAALPVEEQNDYFGKQADEAAERRADLAQRALRFPGRALRGLFYLENGASASLVHPELAPIPAAAPTESTA